MPAHIYHKTDQLDTMNSIVDTSVKQIQIDMRGMGRPDDNGTIHAPYSAPTAEYQSEYQFAAASTGHGMTRLHWHIDDTSAKKLDDGVTVIKNILAEVSLRGSSHVEPGKAIHQRIDVDVTPDGFISEVTSRSAPQLLAAA